MNNIETMTAIQDAIRLIEGILLKHYLRGSGTKSEQMLLHARWHLMRRLNPKKEVA